MSEQPPTEYAPPGWFPDPTGLQAERWWDGTQWSRQTRFLPGNEQEPQLPYQPQQAYGQQPRQPSFIPDPQYGTAQGQPPYRDHRQPEPPAGHRGRPARKSWPQRHKVLTVLGSLTALIIVIAGVASASGKAKQADNASAVATTTPTRTATPSQAPTRHATSTGTVSTRATTAPAAPATTAPAAPATSAPAAPAGPTVSQQQALDSAQSYLALGSGFSRQGLIDQLDSPYGGKFSVADATWAADHAGADWDAQAVLAAKSYMKLGGFSRASLIDQLDSPYGGKFTLAQATYAANQVGL